MEDRLVANVEFTDDCWLWTGNTSNGYGRIRDGQRIHYTHRWVWAHWVGPIPEGYEIDHLCRVTNCVNIDHLEPVPGQVNNMRSNSWAALNKRKTECLRGHAFTPENTHTDKRGRRRCKECIRLRARQRYAERKA